MVEARNESCFSWTQFVLEPGAISWAKQALHRSVNYIKVSCGKQFLILDGGMNHHLAASGNLGQVIKRNFPLEVINSLTIH